MTRLRIHAAPFSPQREHLYPCPCPAAPDVEIVIRHVSSRRVRRASVLSFRPASFAVTASAVQIPPDARAAHRGLSPAAERWVEYLLENPDEARQLVGRNADTPHWWLTYDFTHLTWPTFVDAAKQRELERATVGLCGVIKAIPAVIFDGDLQAIADFYGYPEPSYLEMLYEVPNALDATLARCDFIETAEGLKCCEVNLAGNIGGWQHWFWESAYFTDPVVARFAAREGISPRRRDLFRVAIEHLVRDAVDTGVVDGGELNLMGATLPPTEWAQGFAQELYTELLRQTGRGLTGRLWLTSAADRELAFRGNAAYRGDQRVHAFVEFAASAPTVAQRAQIAGTLRVYNGGLTELQVNKRNLALLSENEELEYWNDEDRALIRDHVPWTRLVSAPRTTTYRGETVEFPGFLLDARADLVLKRGAGLGGADVHVGRYTEPAEWAVRVREALQEGGWIVQAHLESKPYFFPHAPGEAPVEQTVIWGSFCVGYEYAGSWLRMMPMGTGHGIVNSILGAAEAAVLEI